MLLSFCIYSLFSNIFRIISFIEESDIVPFSGWASVLDDISKQKDTENSGYSIKIRKDIKMTKDRDKKGSGEKVKRRHYTGARALYIIIFIM